MTHQRKSERSAALRASASDTPAASVRFGERFDLLAHADSRRVNLLATILFGLAMFSPFMLKGPSASLVVNDNLEHLERFGSIKDGAPIESSWQITQFAAHHLGLFWGLVANEVLCRSVAFAGAWLLLSKLTRETSPPALLVTFVACAFSALPFWPMSDLSVAGIPLALFALAQLRERRHRALSCLALVAFAYHSSPSLSGVPLVTLTAIWLLWQRTRNQKHTWMLLGLVLLIAVYLMLHGLSFDSSRIAALVSTAHLAPDVGDSLGRTFSRALRFFLKSVYFARANHESVLLLSTIAGAAFLIGKKDWRTRRLTLGFGLFAYLASFWFSLEYNQAFRTASLSHSIGKVRWYFLLPGLWYVVWGALLANVVASAAQRQRAALLVLLLIAVQIARNASDTSVRAMFAQPSFSEFVAKDMLDRVKARLVLAADEQVGCVGFYPAVARYNEIRTIGSSFPESHDQREAVRRIIASTLERSSKVRRYFEKPNASVYLFDDEISLAMTDQRKLRRKHNAITADFDLGALREFRVKYLLSTLPFRNAEKAGFQLVLKDASSYYQMFVYQVY